MDLVPLIWVCQRPGLIGTGALCAFRPVPNAITNKNKPHLHHVSDIQVTSVWTEFVLSNQSRVSPPRVFWQISLPQTRPPHPASAASIAATTAGSSGTTSGENRATTFPSRPIRNFSKFHRIPGSGFVAAKPFLLRKPFSFSRNPSRVSPMAFGSASISALYSGSVAGPVTVIFENIGNSTPNVALQNVAISSFDPGSCAPKSFAGKPSTTNPWSLNRAYNCSSPSYCFVNPHLDATFTTSSTLPRYAANETTAPPRH